MNTKTLSSIVITIILLITLFPYPTIPGENAPTDRGDGVLENTGDWIIEEGEDLQYENRTIIINGNLTINGSLDLVDCVVLMNVNYSTIQVTGTLILDTTTISGNGSYYYFMVTGELDSRNSDLFNIAGSTSYPFKGGLQLLTSDVVLEGGRIEEAEFTGVYIQSNVTMRNVTITNNTYNVVVNGSSALLRDCDINGPKSVNIFMTNGSSPLIVEGDHLGEIKFDDEASSLSYGHELHIHAIYENGTSIPDVLVSVTSLYGDLFKTVYTDPTGWVRQLILPEVTIHKSDQDIVYSPYTVRAEKFDLLIMESVPLESETTVQMIMSGDHFGKELVRGDFNGDGLIDLAVGVPNNRTGTTVPGATFVYLNDGDLELTELTEALADFTIRGIEDTGFGSVLASGDINGDGFDDLFISSPLSSGTGTDAGEVNVFYGNGSLSWNDLTEAEFTLGGNPGDHFGEKLHTANLNNDAYIDFIIGDNSNSHVYYGSNDPKYDFTNVGLHYIAPTLVGDEDTTGMPIVNIQTNDDVRYDVKNPNTPNSVMHVTDFPVDELNGEGEITNAIMWIQYSTDKDYGINDHERSYLYYHAGNGWHESLRPIRNGNNWRAETTSSYNLFAEGVNTREQLEQLQFYLDNVDGTGYFSGTENNIYIDIIVVQVTTAPMPANHSLEAGNISSGDVNGDGFPDLIISDHGEQVIYFGEQSGLFVPDKTLIDEIQGNSTRIRVGDDNLTLRRIGQVVNGDFENGWDNWTFMANKQGHQNGNIRMVMEEEGDWEVGLYSEGPTGGFGGDGNHVNGHGGKSTGKLRTDPFLIDDTIDAITLWYRWVAISFDKNEGVNIKIYRSSDDAVLKTIDEWMPTQDSSRIEREEYVTVPVADLRGEMVYVAMETIGGDGGYDDGYFQIDDVDLLPHIYHKNGTFTSDWIPLDGNVTAYTPWWNEDLNNGTILVKFRTDNTTNWEDLPEGMTGVMKQLNNSIDRIQYRITMTNNGSATPYFGDLQISYVREGQIMPMGINSDYGMIGTGDLDGDDIDDLLFYDNGVGVGEEGEKEEGKEGEKDNGIDVYYGHEDLSQEFNASNIQRFYEGNVVGFSVFDLELDGIDELCVIGDSTRILNNNSEIVWEHTTRTNRIHKDVTSDHSFQLNTGRIYFIPSHDVEVLIHEITVPAYVDPGETQAIEVKVGNVGTLDHEDLTLYLNISSVGESTDDKRMSNDGNSEDGSKKAGGNYSYTDSTMVDINSMQSNDIRFLWEVPLEEGVEYSITAEIMVTDDRIIKNNNLNLNVISKQHAINLTVSDPIKSGHGGDDLIYMLAIENIGTFDNETVTLDSVIPENWTGTFQNEDVPIDSILVADFINLTFSVRSPFDEKQGEFTITIIATANTSVNYLNVTTHILRPDLLVNEIQLLRANGMMTNNSIHAIAGEEGTIRIKVTNNGSTYSTEFNLSLFLEDAPIDMFNWDGLAVGESIWFTSPVIPEEGMFNISVQVDLDEAVPEEDESNNLLNRTFTIKGGEPVGPYNISGIIQDIFGEVVGFSEITFEWSGENEDTYADENGSFFLTLDPYQYSDGSLMFINATDGENLTSVQIRVYSEDGGRFLTMTLNQYLVEIEGPDSVSKIHLNETILMSVDIKNNGNTNATVIVEVLESPDDWTVRMIDLPDNRVTLAMGESISVTLEITSSADPVRSRGHQKYFISVIAYSELYPQMNDSFLHGIEVLPLESLVVSVDGSNSTSAMPGKEMDFSFRVENSGNEISTFIPEMVENGWESNSINYSFNISYLTIGIGNEAYFTLSLTTPNMASGSDLELLVGGEDEHITNAMVLVTILDHYGINCEVPSELTASPSDVLSVPLTITNTGNLGETIQIVGDCDVPGVVITGDNISLDMTEKRDHLLRVMVPANVLSGEILPVTINLSTDQNVYINVAFTITIVEVRGISLSLVNTTVIPNIDSTTYTFEIEAQNTGNGENTFHFRMEGSHPNTMSFPGPTTLGPKEIRILYVNAHIPFDSISIIDNYLIPMDDVQDYEDLNLRILSYKPDLATTIDVSQDGDDDYYYYYYDIEVENKGERFEWIELILGLPMVDDYDTGDAQWRGGVDKSLLNINPGMTEEFRIWIRTPEEREYWGSDLTVTLRSETTQSEKLILHKPPLAVIDSTIPQHVTFENILSFTGTQSLWNIWEYNWDFGESIQKTGSTVSHSFGTSGSHLVTLTVVDEMNLTASKTLTVEVENMDPIAQIQVKPQNRTIEVGQTILLDASFSQDRDGEIVDYHWIFGSSGDSFNGMSPIIEYQYETVDTHTIFLYVTDNGGNVVNTTAEITVIPASEKPTSDPDDTRTGDSTIDPRSYLPAAVLVIVMLIGFLFMHRKKSFIAGLKEEIKERSVK